MDKIKRYGIRVFLLDRDYSFSCFTSKENDIAYYLEEEEKRHGLKVVANEELINLKIIYNNVIWEYKVLLGTLKKKNIKEVNNIKVNQKLKDVIDKELIKDLELMGVLKLKDDIIKNILNLSKYEKEITYDIRFKEYGISDSEMLPYFDIDFFKNKLKEFMESGVEPEIIIELHDNNYMIIPFSDKLSFQKMGEFKRRLLSRYR